MDYLDEMEVFARKNKIPVILKDTRIFLENLCKEIQPKKILEVGMAIGYSGAVMLKSCNAFLTSCEASVPNIKLAKQNFEKLGLSDRVEIVEGDCLKTLTKFNDQKFDLIFLDGPKGFYLEILNLLLPLLKKDGILVADNVLFRGMVQGENPIKKHRFENTVKVLKQFNETILNDERLESKILNIGDGLAIVKFKRRNEL